MKMFRIRVNGQFFQGENPDADWGHGTPHAMSRLVFGDEPRHIGGSINLKSYVERIIDADRHGFIDIQQMEIESFDL